MRAEKPVRQFRFTLRKVKVDKLDVLQKLRLIARAFGVGSDKDVAMLVITGDLHLTDGSASPSLAPGAFRIFVERLRELALAASWRVDGSYRPLTRLDVVLLGDVLDLVRSARWVSRKDVRPWTDANRPEFVDTVSRIASDTLRHNDAGLQLLRGLAIDGTLTLPPATSRGAPAAAGEAQAVEVGLHYMVGNRDWFLHLRGPGYDLLRQAVVRQLGLANRATEPFPHDPAENGGLLDLLRRHRVLARHGDLFDPLNFTVQRDASSLGDALVIELIGRFATSVERELGADLPAGVLWSLRELDYLRPLLLAPLWLEGILQRGCPAASQRQRVREIWDRTADEFLSLHYVRGRAADGMLDGLDRIVKFNKRPASGWARQIAEWTERLGGSDDNWHRHAMREADFRNRRARHIVYGHTHRAESVPLDASYADGHVLNQMYFNAGTWRRVHRPTRYEGVEHEFIPSDCLSLVAFYQGDERGGRPFETWTSTLAAAPAPIALHRVDPGRNSTAADNSSDKTHALRPHFTTSIIDAASTTRV